MTVLEILPSGAQLEFYAEDKLVGIDRFMCKPKLPWSDAVCDAMNRLAHAGQVLHAPSIRQFCRPLIGPMVTFASVRLPRRVDKERLLAAFVAADSGDAAPADRLAKDWFGLWPDTCGWRLDMAYEMWQLAAEPITISELWHRLKGLPHVKGLKRDSVKSAVFRAVRNGELRRVQEVEFFPVSAWQFVRTGVQVDYDPLLLRVTTESRRLKGKEG